MNLKKLTLSSLSVIAALVISGCAGPQVKPAEMPEKVKSLKSVVMASYTCPGSKIKKKSIIAVKAPDMLRFEIKGFLNEPFFMLTSKGNKVQAYFVQDNAYFEGEILDASSDSIAAVILNQSGKLKIKDMEISSVFTRKSESSPAPATAEFKTGEYKLSFAFTDPEINKELADSIFELTPPKKARRISEEDINRYFSKWSK